MKSIFTLFTLWISLFLTGFLLAPGNAQTSVVHVLRVPGGGLQPQVIKRNGVVHLVYLQGDPRACDVFYVHSEDEGDTWSASLRVNSQPASALAMGTIRGASLALGRSGRVLVAWNGSDRALPRNSFALATERSYGASPLLFSRLNDAGKAFEPQRNLMARSFGLDGGAAIASNGQGSVYVAWHANQKAGDDEAQRRVFLAISRDDGRSFAPEKPVWNQKTGACGCCQLALMAQGDQIDLMYRAATEMVHRDTYFLSSSDRGVTFQGRKIANWNINMCPMSRFALAFRGKMPLAAWESEERVAFASLDPSGKIIGKEWQAAPGSRHPALGVNGAQQTLVCWSQGTGWNRGGDVRWQTFTAQNEVTAPQGEAPGMPAWSFPTTWARRDGSFVVLY